MSFSSFQRGQPISAKAMRDLQAGVDRAQPKFPGAITSGGGFGITKDDDEWFLVLITAVSGTGAAATYAFTEQNVKPHVTTGVEDRGSPRRADLTANPGRCALASHTFAVDDLALARRNVAAPAEWELLPIGAGGGSDWRPGKITARLGDGPQASYTVQPLKLSGTTYADDGATVTPCYRLDTEDRDEPILIDIPVGAGVLVRPSADDPEKFEMTPWGGLKRSVIEHLYRVCAQCEDVGGGLFKIRVKMAIRHIGEYARDRRALWMPGTHGEENLEDNTDLSIDPD